MQQLYTVNANMTNPGTQYGTSSNGQPAWNQSPGGTTTDSGVTWTNQGTITPWAPSTTWQSGQCIYVLVNGTYYLFISTHNFPTTSGASAPQWNTALLSTGGPDKRIECLGGSTAARWGCLGAIGVNPRWCSPGRPAPISTNTFSRRRETIPLQTTIARSSRLWSSRFGSGTERLFAGCDNGRNDRQRVKSSQPGRSDRSGPHHKRRPAWLSHGLTFGQLESDDLLSGLVSRRADFRSPESYRRSHRLFSGLRTGRNERHRSNLGRHSCSLRPQTPRAGTRLTQEHFLQSFR